ncbi:pentatricopeptide repeat-containing protein At1g09190-like [Daucus carota subsp. sativus]|uniref:pentatricopeptide repeat-containing protein At1g09190-like n=1 Tax=Daucus carota subsp. sativus TaxID=79200 RepID=UPI003082A485
MGNFITHCSTLRRMNYAQKLFDEMSHPNSFVWNTMVRGFQQNQEPRNALILFEKMKMRGVIGDKFTYPFVIRACNDLWEQCRGKCAHGEVLKVGLELDVFVGTSLIEFYSGFESMQYAYRVFEEMVVKDMVAWTAILHGFLSKFGDIERGRELFCRMPNKDMVVWNIMINGMHHMFNVRKLKQAGPSLNVPSPALHPVTNFPKHPLAVNPHNPLHVQRPQIEQARPSLNVPSPALHSATNFPKLPLVVAPQNAQHG